MNALQIFLLSGIPLLPTYWLSLNPAQSQQPISSSPVNFPANDTTKILNLDFGFKVLAGEEEDLGTTKTYTFFQLLEDDSIIFTNETLDEYEFKNPHFPMVLKTGPAAFEVIFEINDRPFNNYLRRFFVKDNQLVKQDKLPMFVGKAMDTNHDGIKEYAGYWQDSEVWGPQNSLTAYNPVIIYAVRENGLQIDTALTIERNTGIYGQFQGYFYNEKSEQPVSVIKKFDAVLKLYESDPAESK